MDDLDVIGWVYQAVIDNDVVWVIRKGTLRLGIAYLQQVVVLDRITAAWERLELEAGQTYSTYAFCGEFMAGPALLSTVTPDMLPQPIG